MSHVVFLMRFQYETAELAELWNVIQKATSSYLFLSDREKKRYRAEITEKKSPSKKRTSTNSQRWRRKESTSYKPTSPSKMSSVGIFDEKESIKDRNTPNLNTQTVELPKEKEQINIPKSEDPEMLNEEGKEKSVDRKIDELPDLLTIRKERAENRRMAKLIDEKKRALEEENVIEKAHIELAKQISLQPPTKTSNFDQQACSSQIEEGGRSRVKLLEKLNLDEINEVIMECSRNMKKYSQFIEEVRKQQFKHW